MFARDLPSIYSVLLDNFNEWISSMMEKEVISIGQLRDLTSPFHLFKKWTNNTFQSKEITVTVDKSMNTSSTYNPTFKLNPNRQSLHLSGRF